MMQMQMYVAVAAAEAAGDHEFGEAVRAGWMRAVGHRPPAARRGRRTRRRPSWRTGCSSTALVAMGFPPEHRVWEGCTRRRALKGRLET